MISAREAKELTLKNAEVDIKDELAEIEKGILESVEAKKFYTLCTKELSSEAEKILCKRGYTIWTDYCGIKGTTRIVWEKPH
ncbi:hypothetical protein RO865_17880 [Blautia faecis]|uniref:hypothetical protein n=1 Tax=Blautia faecis TaxID=871665 RepID=UPI0028A3A267|nr:hypothetical protein [Blautia faecis]MDT4370644.1 hypothetical protein [Blautia faecis]